MNKLELISALKDRTSLTKAEAAEVVRIFFDKRFLQLPYQGIQKLYGPEPQNR